MITVVELPEFMRQAQKLLDDEERFDLIAHLATHPMDGVIMQGTGGIRKLRWARRGTGKSGGVRVIYFFYNPSMPLFLLTLFGKSEKENLSMAERNELQKLTRILRQRYGERDE